MNILVTGGAGFIGSHTVIALVEAGHTPIMIDNFANSEKSILQGIKQILNQQIICYENDCNDANILKKIIQTHHIQGVIHFAAYKAVGESVQKPLMYYQNNVGSLVTLLQVMDECKVDLLVFSSSCTVYGEPDKIPVTEATPRKPATSPYGNTKTMCEDIIRDTIASGASLKTTLLRYFNPIGAHPSAHIGELPRGVPNNLIPFITQTAAGWREQLTVFGNDYDTLDGSNIRDYIDVMDLAEAHVKAIEYLEKQPNNFQDVFNIGTGRGCTVLEVVKTFEEVTNTKLNYTIGNRRAGDVEKIYAVVDKSETELGWKATRTFAQSLETAWRWQQKLEKPN